MPKCWRCKELLPENVKACTKCGLKLKKSGLDASSSETKINQKLEDYAFYFDPEKSLRRAKSKSKRELKKRKDSTPARVATVPNPKQFLPPLGSTTVVDRQTEFMRTLLESKNAEKAELAYKEIDALKSESLVFPDVREELLSPDARATARVTSAARVSRILHPTTGTMERQWLVPGGEIDMEAGPNTPVAKKKAIDTVHIDEYLGNVGSVGDQYAAKLAFDRRPPSGPPVSGEGTHRNRPPESGWFWGGTDKDARDAENDEEADGEMVEYGIYDVFSDEDDDVDDGRGSEGEASRRTTADTKPDEPRQHQQQQPPPPPVSAATGILESRAPNAYRVNQKDAPPKDTEFFFWGAMAQPEEAEADADAEAGGGYSTRVKQGEAAFDESTVVAPASPEGLLVSDSQVTKESSDSGPLQAFTSDFPLLEGELPPSPAASWISFIPDPKGLPEPRFVSDVRDWDLELPTASHLASIMPGAQSAYDKQAGWPLNQHAIKQRKAEMGEDITGLDESMVSINTDPALLASMMPPKRAVGPNHMSHLYTAANKRLQHINKLSHWDYRIDALSDPNAVRMLHYLWRELQAAISQGEQAETLARESYETFQRDEAVKRTDLAAATASVMAAVVAAHKRFDEQWHKLKVEHEERQKRANLKLARGPAKTSKEMDALKVSAEKELRALGIDLESAQAAEAAALQSFREKEVTAIRTVRHWRPIVANLLHTARIGARRMEYLAKTSAVRTIQRAAIEYMGLRSGSPRRRRRNRPHSRDGGVAANVS